MQEPAPEPVAFGRYALAGLLGAALLGGLLLLARPLLFSVVEPLDDSNYAVAASGQVIDTPVLRHLLLNESHGLLGELTDGARTEIGVVVAPLTLGGYSVVNAWSPTHDCALEIGADRLRDCAGDAWTFDGVPLDSADPPLEAFPATISNGAIMVDFTRVTDPRTR